MFSVHSSHGHKEGGEGKKFPEKWLFLGLGLVLGHSKSYKQIAVIGLLSLATLGKR